MNDTSKASIHLRFLKKFKEYLVKKYSQGYALNCGEPITTEQSLNQYLEGGHFHKNFYTNYHALYDLFYGGQNAISIPEMFYVYDIACGPYTATLSLLNFLQNEGSLAGKSFVFNFCEKEDWLLTRLCDANKGAEYLAFPVPLSLFTAPRFSVGDIVSRFDDLNWCINTRQCAKSDCDQHSRRELGQIPQESSNALNLILCSYPGKHPKDPKYIKCIGRTIYSLSLSQRNFPIYIIYSHYKDRSSSFGRKEIRETVTERLKRLNVEFISDNADIEVPFYGYYHCIFRSEAHNAAT